MEVYIAVFFENLSIYLEMESETLNFVRYLSVELFFFHMLHSLYFVI